MKWFQTFLFASLMVVVASCGRTPLDTASELQNSSNNSSNSGGNGTNGVIDPPANITAEALSASSIEIRWNNPSVSDDYSIIIQYKKSTESNFTELAGISDASEYRLSGLIANTQYDIRLQTKLDDGDTSLYSNPVSAKTKVPATPLAGPTNVRISEGKLPIYWNYTTGQTNVEKFTIQFQLVAQNGSGIITGYFPGNVTYVSSMGSYQATMDIDSVCKAFSTAWKVFYKVQALPKDDSINTASAWADADSGTMCPIIR